MLFQVGFEFGKGRTDCGDLVSTHGESLVPVVLRCVWWVRITHRSAARLQRLRPPRPLHLFVRRPLPSRLKPPFRTLESPHAFTQGQAKRAQASPTAPLHVNEGVILLAVR